MTGHFNNLTPAQAERFAILAEECAEVIQVIGKILRHGLDSWHPDCRISNRAMLEKELGDVRAAEWLVMQSEDISEGTVSNRMTQKLCKLPLYVHHNRDLLDVPE